MSLALRIKLMVELGEYLAANTEEWQTVKAQAGAANAWFSPQFIDMATSQIVNSFLQQATLEKWCNNYNIKDQIDQPLAVGIVMAGNIPLVGFHDLLCVWLSGHQAVIKCSSKDDVLIKHLVQKMYEMEIVVQNYISIADKLTNCDAYIATGSNNSGRYFDYYFGKKPNIIRKNRTSVAVLTGSETMAELENLADDIQTYFGLGCRNVTKLYVPEDYNFSNLLKALEKYDYYMDFHKYKHNFDYQLALLMMNSKFYYTNGSILITENESIFSAISQIHFGYYNNKAELLANLRTNESIQCIVSSNLIAMGMAQKPAIDNYADGVDTMHFLTTL